MAKILIIRFTSFGDILQATAVLPALRKKYPKAEIHWLVKENFKNLVEQNQDVDFVWSFPKSSGLSQLLKLAFQIHESNFSHIYDAHRSLRSLLLIFLLRLLNPFNILHGRRGTRFVSRSKHRIKRLLLFKLRINKFPRPFIGSRSFLEPLKKWGIDDTLEKVDLQFSPEQRNKVAPLITSLDSFIAIAPSAAWAMKRWPLQHWKTLVKLQENRNFAVLGGPDDQFCQELADLAPQRVYNFAGKLSLMESLYLVSQSQLLVSADTGVLHGADGLDHPHIALIGPTAFGYTGRSNGHTLEVELKCRPCSKDGRDPCTNDLEQRCMVEITPQRVSQKIDEVLKRG